MTWKSIIYFTKIQIKHRMRKPLMIFISIACLLLHVNYYPNNKVVDKGTIPLQSFYLDVYDSSQLDPQLISYIRDNVINPPSGQKYNLFHPELRDASQDEQGLYLMGYFREKKNGTFIEAGAWNGEVFSNTLILERELGWTGLLIEPNPRRYHKLTTKNRKAQSANCCISVTPKPAKMNITIDKGISHIVGFFNDSSERKSTKVNCYPLYSLMAAANLTTVDLLSLDVESLEMKILETIPWEKVDIKSLLIEGKHIPEGEFYLKYFLTNKKYSLHKKFNLDYFYVKGS